MSLPRPARIAPLALIALLLGVDGAPSSPRATQAQGGGDDELEAGAQTDTEETGAQTGTFDTWLALVERDRRVGFTARTEEAAGRDLASGRLSETGRAAALYAIGVGGAIHERPRLEEAVLIGTLAERQAAILALGEAGVGVEALLGAEVEDPEIGQHALLALLRTGRLAARQRADAIARGDGPLAEVVPELLRFLAEPEASRPTPATELLLDLRWRAARAYGLVDGEAWSTLLRARLLEDELFLDRVVLPAAAELSFAGVRDHLLGPLLEVGGSAAVRAAVHALPEELEELLIHQLWQPSADDWHAALEQIAADGAPDNTVPLLRRAQRIAELRLRAVVLQARAKETGELETLTGEWTYLSPADRVLVCEAWGSSGLDAARSWLDGRDRDASPRVRAAVVIARARLGDTGSRDQVFSALTDLSVVDRDEFIDLCTGLAWDQRVGALLNDGLETYPPDLKVRAAAALCLEGRLTPLPILLDALIEGVPEGEFGLQLLEAVAKRGTADNRQELFRLFPYERDGQLPSDVNTLLVRLMLRGKDLRALPLLRSALWRTPFDRSLLAGALIIDIGGGYTLRQEIIRQPVDRKAADYRRVGFAVGVFGGLEGFRALAAHPRIQPGDPVLTGAFLGAMSARTH